MSKHTPGPWKVKSTPDGGMGKSWKEVYSSEGRPVVVAASFDRTREGETETHCGVQMSEANARLVAASPEMLAALTEAETTLRGYYNKRAATSALVVADRVRAVIAKAKGGA